MRAARRSLSVFFLPVFLACSIAISFTSTSLASTFPDVEPTWVLRPVEALRLRGIVSGYPDGSYRPQQPVTRAEFLKMLIICLNEQTSAERAQDAPSPFGDMGPSLWANGFVTVAAELNIAQGYDDGDFKPDRPIRRVELVSFLIRAWQVVSAHSLDADSLEEWSKIEAMFSDSAEIPSWGRGPVAWSVTAGLIEGYPGGRFRPDQNATRGEVAAVLFRFLRQLGLLYHVQGELMSVEDTSSQPLLRISVNDETREIPFTTEPLVFRQGHAIDVDGLKPLDQISAIVDPKGRAVFIDSHFADEIGYFHNKEESTIIFRPVNDDLTPDINADFESAALLPDSKVFKNGQIAGENSLREGDLLYMVKDAYTGGVRYLDAITVDVMGEVVSVQEGDQLLVVETREKEPTRTKVFVPSDVTIIGRSKWLTLSDLTEGELLAIAVADQSSREVPTARFLQVIPEGER